MVARSITLDDHDQRLIRLQRNRLRSPTAEQIFSTWPGIETDSAASPTARACRCRPSSQWADIIFVMEDPPHQAEQEIRPA
jgi:predicted protein tyrosine phosphatase